MKSDYDFSDIARELRNRNELVAYEVEATGKIAEQLRGLRQLLQSRKREAEAKNAYFLAGAAFALLLSLSVRSLGQQ